MKKKSTKTQYNFVGTDASVCPQKGITLIALIITIIVMLILVGVTVSVALNGGLFTTAKTAASKTEIELYKEQLFQAALGTVTENAYVDFTKLDENLPDGFEGSSGTYKRNNITYRVNCYGEVTAVDFSSMLNDVLNKPEIYLEKAEDLGQDTQLDKNIGIGTDGNVVNLKIWTYEVVNNETISISAYNGDIINGKIEGTIPQYIYVDEFKKNIPVTSITGRGTLANLSELEEITLPDTLTKISPSIFANCTSLKTIIIPNGVTSIPVSAFHNCTSLRIIIIPNGVTSIGNTAFNKCTSLETIAIPDTITNIGQAGTFQYCSSLTSITIPNGVTTIGTNTFLMCTSLTSITIPSSVTRIQSNAFSRCTSLTLIEVDNTENAIAGSPWGATNATIRWLKNS